VRENIFYMDSTTLLFDNIPRQVVVEGDSKPITVDVNGDEKK
jgi:hypothetical protein